MHVISNACFALIRTVKKLSGGPWAQELVKQRAEGWMELINGNAEVGARVES